MTDLTAWFTTKHQDWAIAAFQGILLDKLVSGKLHHCCSLRPMCLTTYVTHLCSMHLLQLCLKCNLPTTNDSLCEVKQVCISEQCLQQTHPLPNSLLLSLQSTTITNIADNSALLAFSNTCTHYAPKLPSVRPWGQHAIRLGRLIASGAHTLHAKLSTITLFLIPTSQPHVQCSWHQHCHDTHMAGEVIQAVQMLARDSRMQTRSLTE